MTEEAKKPTRKSAAKKSETAAKAPAKKAPEKKTPTAPAKPRATKKGPKYVRNLRGTTVHVRLEHSTREKPFRLELKPRGLAGDTKVVPVEAQGGDFKLNLGLLYEVISESEYMKLQEQYPQVGYTPRREAPVLVREEDTRIAVFQDWDGKGRKPDPNAIPERTSQGRQNPEAVAQHPRQGDNVGPYYPNVPGADQGLHAQLNGGEQEGALPPGMSFQRPSQIVMERTRG